MFDDIGLKVKSLAKFVFWCGIGLSLLIGIALAFVSGIIAAVAVAIGGSLFSWILSWALYAIGETAENSAKLVERLCPAEDESREFDPDTWAVVRKVFGSMERVPKFYKWQLEFLENLKREERITEEEYQERLNSIKSFMK